MNRKGNCLVLLLAILVLIWLIFMGGCQLIAKKTQEGLQDTKQPIETPTKANK